MNVPQSDLAVRCGAYLLLPPLSVHLKDRLKDRLEKSALEKLAAFIMLMSGLRFLTTLDIGIKYRWAHYCLKFRSTVCCIFMQQ